MLQNSGRSFSLYEIGVIRENRGNRPGFYNNQIDPQGFKGPPKRTDPCTQILKKWGSLIFDVPFQEPFFKGFSQLSEFRQGGRRQLQSDVSIIRESRFRVSSLDVKTKCAEVLSRSEFRLEPIKSAGETKGALLTPASIIRTTYSDYHMTVRGCKDLNIWGRVTKTHSLL